MATTACGASARRPETMRLSWGVEHPHHVARTSNISKQGMFIEASEPVESGATVRISLRLAACTLPLRGRVAWTRCQPDEHGPSGMGIALLRPPALYMHYVDQLLTQANCSDSHGLALPGR